jgi:hypothetical protein
LKFNGLLPAIERFDRYSSEDLSQAISFCLTPLACTSTFKVCDSFRRNPKWSRQLAVQDDTVGIRVLASSANCGKLEGIPSSATIGDGSPPEPILEQPSETAKKWNQH